MIVFLSIIFSIFLNISFADESVKTIKGLTVDCQQTQEQCALIYNRFEDFVGLTYSEKALRDRMRFKLIDHPFEKFSFKVLQESDGYILNITATQKKVINSIMMNYNAQVSLPSMASYLTLSEGDYFDKNKQQRVEESLNKFLADRGFVSPEINFISTEREDGAIDLMIDVKLKGLTKIDEVRIATSNPRLLGRVKQKFQGFEGQILDRLQFKLVVDLLARELFESGFYDSEVTLLPEETSPKGGVIIRVQVNYGSLHSFHFRGNHYLSRAEILDIINNSIKQNLAAISTSELVKSVEQAYKDRGHYNVDVKVREARGVNKSELSYVNYFFDINEGAKVKLMELSFTGNSSVEEETLRDLYYEQASVLASRDYLDEQYLQSFKEALKKYYLSKGYVLAEVVDPVIKLPTKNEAQVKFTIRERQRSTISSLRIRNIDKEVEQEIISTLKNQVGRPVDITVLEQDLELIEKTLHEKGYYYAQIENIDEGSLLKYSSTFSEVDINIVVTNQQLTKVNSVILTGFEKTKNAVLNREVRLSPGDLLTPEKIQQLRESMISLDLFSNVQVTPYIVEEKSDDQQFMVNLVVQVVEKAFGVIEVAPGYRTDLGAKISTGITYNNLQGMNRSTSLRLEANQRFDYSDFDSRRREEEREVLEYDVRWNYTEPWLFPKLIPTKVQFDTGVSFQRQRFVSFDADILRVSPQISKTFFDKLTMSLKYQFETINQFDATNPDFNDNFTIGSITPAATLDLRNDPVRPTKGAYFGLNWEFANPYFLSMDDEDIVVNYYRLTSRNNFYIPVGKFASLAISLAGGVQKNFANQAKVDDNGTPLRDENGRLIRRGFIPSTKVFRLDGIDTVRGYSGEEINRIISGENIGEVVVDDVAYFVNFKFEPRYYVSDSFAMGIFYDAGRVFVESFELLELKSSVGATFKILTPVGSLDFDYGVKTKRERDDTGDRESFGRFHLSIGFF